MIERLQVAGYELAINHEDDDQWVVWLNTEDGVDDDGLCVGIGDERDVAVADAVHVFEQLLEKLQEPKG